MLDKSKTNYIWVGLAFVVVIFLAFILISNSNKPQEVICNSPYIKVGNSCCIDTDNNNICDNDQLSLDLAEQLKELRHFCVIEYCETPQPESGYKYTKTAIEKEKELSLFCADLRVEFNNYCKPDRSDWGDFCYIRNERIEMFCNEIK